VTPRDVKKLAYDCATRYNIPMPKSWQENKEVDSDWLGIFLKRNKVTRNKMTSIKPKYR